ncbi:Nucleoside diphosphate kinase [Candidatus Cyrtobacter comes]|uniref:Nucleoside diphosphate kinase n=1 Tax=Candidatus Cyrtobacter comes TaxID=675776 RepID=A0ABU5L9X9_9RICK|nr:nucleoside-diphosphate kinase [Candidatus Cyrtobacter comes]MDZ5762700.1 Nucleoside diphosphate kinase [Candidatus Cyrtobacter comes]
MERTLCIIKPDAFKYGYVSGIEAEIKNAGFNVVKSLEKRLSEQEAREFYAEHGSRSFFPSLVNYMTSGSVLICVLEHVDGIKKFRELMGATNPIDAKDGTIRKKYGTSIDENAIHGSDSKDAAQREIKFFFG